MNTADAMTLTAIMFLDALAIWLSLRKLAALPTGRWWRIVFGHLSLIFVTASILLFIVLRIEFARTPSVAANLDVALAILRRYTRFYPEYVAIVGVLCALLAEGRRRWLTVASGILIAAWWFLFVLTFV